MVNRVWRRELVQVTTVADPETVGADAPGWLRAGDFAPDFRLNDASGRSVSLSAILKRGAVVLCFFDARTEASALDDSKALARHGGRLVRSGATILVLARACLALPASPALAHYLVDADFAIASAYGLGAPPLRSRKAATDHSGDVRRIDGETFEAPIPATFVIDRCGRIVVSLINIRFANKIVPQNVLGALSALRRRARFDMT